MKKGGGGGGDEELQQQRQQRGRPHAGGLPLSPLPVLRLLRAPTLALAVRAPRPRRLCHRCCRLPLPLRRQQRVRGPPSHGIRQVGINKYNTLVRTVNLRYTVHTCKLQYWYRSKVVFITNLVPNHQRWYAK